MQSVLMLNLTLSILLFLSKGNTVAEIGASYIHGPCEENPVFCLVRDYGLLHPEAPSVENQSIDVTECPPWTVNWFSDSGAT